MSNFVHTLQSNKAQKMYSQQGIDYLGVFGSVARGEETLSSDVDVLVNFNEVKTLFDLADVKIFLEDLLKRKVDLVLKGSIKPKLKPYIEQDLITVYEKN